MGSSDSRLILAIPEALAIQLALDVGAGWIWRVRRRRRRKKKRVLANRQTLDEFQMFTISRIELTGWRAS